MIIHHQPLILASGSAIRQQMMRAAGLTFSVEISGVDEEKLKTGFDAEMPPEDKAILLARAKALGVSARRPEAYVIGADQICALGTRIFDKPETFANAEATLRALAGQTHQQHSGLVLAKGGEVVWQTVGTAHLTMRALSEAEIQAYVAADEPLASCGAYKYEALGKHLFSQVDGSTDVIQGLSLQALIYELHRRGVIALAA